MPSKQKFLHSAAAVRRSAAVYAAVCTFGICAGGFGARGQTKVVPQTGAQMSTVRLLSAGGLHDGKYEAGVDLTMLPGSHTYWKIPGEAGVPPVFTFNGSDNVTKATVSYPVPSRISEEGIEAFGYTDHVVFPVAVTPSEPGKAATLHLDISYAVCSKICVPGHDKATLTLTPHGAPVGGKEVAAALAKVPRPVGAAPDLAITRMPGEGDPAWTLEWSGPRPPDDIFPVAPEGFFFDSKKTAPARWKVTAERSVTAPKARQVPVTLVLSRDEAPTSVSETFDLGAAAK